VCETGLCAVILKSFLHPASWCRK